MELYENMRKRACKMTTGNQERITQKWSEIAQWEAQKESGVSLQTQEQIDRDIKAAKKQIAELEAVDQAAEFRKKVEDEGIAFNVAGVDMTSLPSEVIQLVEIIVKNDRKRIYFEETENLGKITEMHKAQMDEVKGMAAEVGKQTEDLKNKIYGIVGERDALQTDRDAISAELKKANIERDDYRQRLDNAATIIGEKDAEINRLNSEISEMRATATYGEKTAQSIIDVTPESVTEVQSLVDAIAKKYIASKPIGGNWHELVADDGSKEVVHARDLPSIEQQELPFQPNEAAEADTTSDQLPVANEVKTVAEPLFRIEAPEIGTQYGLADRASTEPGEGAETATKSWVRSEIAKALAEIQGEQVAS